MILDSEHLIFAPIGMNSWALAYALIGLNLADCITTKIGVKHYGVYELNPVARLLFRLMTVNGAMVCKCVVVSVLALAGALIDAQTILLATVLLYAFTVGWNIGRLRAYHEGGIYRG